MVMVPLVVVAFGSPFADAADRDVSTSRVDVYTNYAHLAGQERENVAYRILVKPQPGLAVIAPHGGRIEAGTSEIAEGVAGTNFAFYAFEGLLEGNNRKLHITSTRFDEPRAMQMVTNATMVLTIHGESSSEEVVYIGGRNEDLCRKLTEKLRAAGFDVRTHPRKELQGLSSENICNRGKPNGGVQLELSAGLRRACFLSAYPGDLSVKSLRYETLVKAIRAGL